MANELGKIKYTDSQGNVGNKNNPQVLSDVDNLDKVRAQDLNDIRDKVNKVVDFLNGENNVPKPTNSPVGSGSANVADGSITTAKLADRAVTGTKIALKTITSDEIADGTIDNDQLAPDAVDTAEIKDKAITKAKLADGVSVGGGVAGITSNGNITITKDVNVKNKSLWLSDTRSYSKTDNNRVLNAKHTKELGADEGWYDGAKALHQVEIHKRHLGVDNPKVNALADYGFTDGLLKSAWDETTSTENSIFGIFNQLTKNDAQVQDRIYAEGYLDQPNNYFFSTILKTELQRQNGYLYITELRNAKHFRMRIRKTTPGNYSVLIINADYGTANYGKGVRFIKTLSTGNWDNGLNTTIANGLSDHFVYETLDANETYVTNTSDAVESLEDYVLSKTNVVAFKDITSSYRTRDFTNDYGKFVRITTSSRHLIGELKQNYKISNYDKAFNGVYAKSFLTDDTPSQSYIWATGNTTLTYQNRTTSYNLTNDKIYHFQLTPTEAITKFEIVESFPLAEVIKETQLVTLASLTPTLKDQIGIEVGVKGAKALLASNYNSSGGLTTRWNHIYFDTTVFQDTPIQYSRYSNYDDLTLKLKDLKPGYYTLRLKLTTSDSAQYGLTLRNKYVYARQTKYTGNAGSLPGTITKGTNVYCLQDIYPYNETRVKMFIYNDGTKADIEIESKQFKRVIVTNGVWGFETRDNNFYDVKSNVDVIDSGRRGATVFKANSDFTIRITNKSNRAVNLTDKAFVALTREVSA